MAKEISQRELRNDSGQIMRELDQGSSFVVTRRGEPIGELIPLRRRRFVGAASVLAMFAGAPSIDGERFRHDLDEHVDPDIEPRA